MLGIGIQVEVFGDGQRGHREVSFDLEVASILESYTKC
jgi:hypothetical protein